MFPSQSSPNQTLPSPLLGYRTAEIAIHYVNRHLHGFKIEYLSHSDDLSPVTFSTETLFATMLFPRSAVMATNISVCVHIQMTIA
jgi:hypothetical protein